MKMIAIIYLRIHRRTPVQDHLCDSRRSLFKWNAQTNNSPLMSVITLEFPIPNQIRMCCVLNIERMNGNFCGDHLQKCILEAYRMGAVQANTTYNTVITISTFCKIKYYTIQQFVFEGERYTDCWRHSPMKVGCNHRFVFICQRDRQSILTLLQLGYSDSHTAKNHRRRTSEEYIHFTCVKIWSALADLGSARKEFLQNRQLTPKTRFCPFKLRPTDKRLPRSWTDVIMLFEINVLPPYPLFRPPIPPYPP